ncbi:hypothetical protein GWI33_008047 [Rhynchophorus ferrugineus]|uniref:Uncharacterized protein n=1 Tax=Rhynchophorus ferrugineus TaxID=354439 RepID=A0A834IIY5_RHYFE|nr:hypothetical protein GWI33_008047 [Rhynchophorus ferrugineus]
MEKSAFIKKIYHYSKTGEFLKITEQIKDTEISEEIALNILIYAANACCDCKNELHKINEKNLYALLKHVAPCIKMIKETQLEAYLKTIFHILKVLVDKEDYENVSKVKFVVLPVFLNEFVLKDIKEAKYVYQQIVTKLFNSIYNIAKVKNTNYNPFLLDIINIILQANIKINDNKNTLALAQKLLSAIEYLGLESEMLGKFYILVIQVLGKSESSETQYSPEDLKIYLEMFSQVMSSLLKVKKYDCAEQLVLTITEHSSDIKVLILQELFSIVTNLFPSCCEKLLYNLAKCKDIIKSLSKHKDIFFDIVILLEEPLAYILTDYRNEYVNKWQNISAKSFDAFLIFFKEYVLENWFGEKGAILTDKKVKSILTTGWHIHKLVLNYIENNKDLTKPTYTSTIKWLEYFFPIIKQTKINGNEKWADYYKTVVLYLNNIGVVLYQQKNVSYVHFYEEVIRRCIEFEDLKPTIIKDSLIEKAFNVICEMYYKNGDFKKCMAIVALYSLLYLEFNPNIFHFWWIKSKVKAKQDMAIQIQTLLTSLKLNEVFLSKIVDTKQYLTEERKLQLLSFELVNYKLTYKSKIPIKEAFCQLIEIADTGTIAKAVVTVFGDGDITLHDNLPNIFDGVMKKIEDNTDETIHLDCLMALAVLQYYHYKTVSKEIVKKSTDEVEKNQKVINTASERFEPVPADPNDVCDIVTAYDNLTITKFLEVLNSLIKALNNIQLIAGESLSHEFISSAVNLLIKIGLEFRLHCFSLKSLQAFELGFKLAKEVADYERQLLCISFLIESADIERTLIKEMIYTGDMLVGVLKGNDTTYDKSLIIYFLSKCKVFLYKDRQSAYEAWQNASGMLEKHKDNDNFGFLQAELYILDFKLTKSCHFRIGEHEKNPMTTKLHNALDIVCDLSRKDGVAMGTHERCILFDTVYELNKMYLLMRLPRDLRCYSKNSLVLTQKLLLPMKSVQFLILLAHCDLLTCQIDHCNVKLNGINDIFCLDQLNGDNEDEEAEVDQVTCGIVHLALNSNDSNQLSPLSEYLPPKYFKLPSFLEHEKDCMCFFCTCIEYHQLLIDKYRLDALLNMHRNNCVLATNYIRGSLRLHKKLRNNYSQYREKIKGLISDDLIPDFEDYFLESYANLLHDYSYHLSRISRTSEALDLNTRLLKMLAPRKLEFVHLYSDTLLQRISYVTHESPVKSENNVNLGVTSTENASLTTTPKDKKNAVIVKINSSYNVSPPKQNMKNKTALFKSPAEAPNGTNAPNENTTPTKTVKNPGDFQFEVPKTKGKKKHVQLFETPVQSYMQTPKINIFMEDTPSMANGRRSRRQTVNNKKSKEENSEENAKKMTRLTRSSRALIIEDNGTKVNSDTEENQPSNTASVHQPIISKTTRTRGQVLAQKIRESNIQIETTNNLKKNLTANILNDKIKLVTRSRSVAKHGNEDSCTSGSPEHDSLNARSKMLVEKLKKSGVKNRDGASQNSTTKTDEKGIKVKKNLLREF